MYPQNLHTHGNLCDGKDAYEDTVKKAIELGFTSIGFSEHSTMSYSPRGGLSPENVDVYKKTVYDIKKKYAGIIDVFCGIEFDMYSETRLDGFEYIIGSMHYFNLNGEMVAFDRPLETVLDVIKNHFGGDALKYAKTYYEQIIELPTYAKGCDIVGHYDILAKNNQLFQFIDENDKTYRAYALEAVRALSKRVGIFEINTGAIARGYRSTAYPAPFILKEIKKCGCDVTISSDCHDKNYLNFKFDEATSLAKECGFNSAVILTRDGFKPISL